MSDLQSPGGRLQPIRTTSSLPDYSPDFGQDVDGTSSLRRVSTINEANNEYEDDNSRRLGRDSLATIDISRLTSRTAEIYDEGHQGELCHSSLAQSVVRVKFKFIL